MRKVLKIVPELCTGCALCELACSWVQVGAFDLKASVIKVHHFGEQLRFAPYTCLQCDEAWCMTACPTAAITIDPDTEAKVVLEQACLGCSLCGLACPYGTIFYHPGRQVAIKCDLCRGDPACARFCPTNAVQYVPGDSPQDWIGAWAEANNVAFLRMWADLERRAET